MKIILQTSDDLVLKEGGASGIILGVVFAIGGMAVAVLLSASNHVAIWIGIAVIAIGILSILFSSSIMVDFNKTSGRISYQKKRLVGGQAASYNISDVLRVETRRRWQMMGGGPSTMRGGAMPQENLVSQSVIVFKDGRELPLDHQKASSTFSIGPAVLMRGQGKESAVASQVANFLGVPFQEISPPTSGINVGAGEIEL